jgi:hypothetical protein
VLLALRNTFGNKTGLKIKTHLLDVCKEYKISNRIAYLMSDNATICDAAVEQLGEHLDIQPLKARLRCTAHTINLVAKSMLFGVDSDCIAQVIREHGIEEADELHDETSAFRVTLRSSQVDEQATLKAWRKRGPVSKLHNLVVHARASPLRRAVFKAKQREAIEDARYLFELVSNGGIRWNSIHDMIERAFKLKDALELY